MTPTLILLVSLIVLSVCAAAWVAMAGFERQRLLERASGGTSGPSILATTHRSRRSRLAEWIARRLGDRVQVSQEASSVLVHAGFDGAAAPVVYGILRMVVAVGGIALAWLLLPRNGALSFALWFGVCAYAALFAIPALVNNMAGRRREKIRRSVPDALDLLVVCVEAGISLDAAILRVAREMAMLHPILSSEFLIVNRRVNAGMPREEALHGLWIRSGVEELRGLAANMIQSEKWGTSIATVLRVYAEQLRRKRKQTAEKKAAIAPLKMLFPLGLFIFPALFVVILGPAAIRMYQTLIPALAN